MKLLFIENRHKTHFFEPIANQLSKNGHEIHWLVQNKQFLPSGNTKKYIIDYPQNKINNFKKDEDVEGIIKSDRQINHFKKKDSSYFYYYNDKIEVILKELKPEIVFGESTAFHELLTIHNCKKLNILYLNPSSCRYPIGRFSFYKYDTLEPYLGSNELLSNKEAEDVIDQIINRKTTPDYMKPSLVSKIQILKDKVNKIYAYTKGEKYNTPNPLVKYQLEKKKKANIEVWDTKALKEVDTGNSFKVLYPLQMQPEANIDVWGKEHRNQTALIKKISKCLPKDCVLYVKPNPKSKYELTEELIMVVQKNKNIIALKHITKMDRVLPKMDLVITVTGTVAIECILVNKPVITLVKTLNNSAKNCMYITKVDRDLSKAIDSIKMKTFLNLDRQGKINFIILLNSTSYKGIISDPFSDANSVSKKNLEDNLNAFNEVIYKTLEK